MNFSVLVFNPIMSSRTPSSLESVSSTLSSSTGWLSSLTDSSFLSSGSNSSFLTSSSSASYVSSWLPLILSFVTGSIVSYGILKSSPKLLSTSFLTNKDPNQTTPSSATSPIVPPPQQVRDGIAGLIGRTPLVRIHSLSLATGCEIYGKAEFLNPGGSSKDRFALQLLKDIQSQSLVQSGGTLVEGTSGSTGISIALLARAFHYQCNVVIPDDIAPEKVSLLKYLGANITMVKPLSIVNKDHYVNIAKTITMNLNTQSTLSTIVTTLPSSSSSGSSISSSLPPLAYFCNQFESLSNYRAHYYTTGPEIWSDTQGKIDAFIMGAGTGGTIAGVGTYLKEVSENRVQIYLVDPPGSCLYNRIVHGVAYASQQSERKLKRHRYDTIIEGVGLDRITENFQKVIPICTSGFTCTDQEAIDMSRYLLLNDGIFIGSSTAMNCVGVVKLARKLGPGKTIVTLLCDSGIRHMGRFWNTEYLHSLGYSTDTPILLPNNPESLNFIA